MKHIRQNPIGERKKIEEEEEEEKEEEEEEEEEPLVKPTSNFKSKK